VRDRRRARDQQHPFVAGEQPGQHDLSRCCLVLAGNPGDRRLFGESRRPAPVRRAEGEEGHECDPSLPSDVHEPVVLAIEDAVAVLDPGANLEALKSGKRERLVESATALFHEQGVHRTTLAEVAERAEVPPGNVYYYFKTKDELVGAVLDSYLEQAETLIDTFERGRTPQARLKALVRNWVDMREAVVRHGCPMGTLCAELDKNDSGLDREAVKVMARIIDWAEEQFRQLGKRDARDLALALFSGVQGAALLANAFRDPTILDRQTRHLERWIDSIST
jgi:TetR/AcrR family transcriptional regulator, transcriptional repressor for nem operon